MDARELKVGLLKGLNNLTNKDVERLRDEFNSEGDYGIDEYGNSYWIPPKNNNISIKYNYKRLDGFKLISDNIPVTINNTKLPISENVNQSEIKITKIAKGISKNINSVAV